MTTGRERRSLTAVPVGRRRRVGPHDEPPWFRYGTWAVLAAIILAGVIGSGLGG